MSMELLNYMEVATGVMQHQYGAQSGVVVVLAGDGTLKCTRFGQEPVKVTPGLELLPSAGTADEAGGGGGNED